MSREIARAQRIVEGQNFEIRRTLWKYSALVEEQRRIVYDWRQSLLADEADPGICVENHPDHYAMLADAAGADAVRHAEQAISFACSMTVGPITSPSSKMCGRASTFSATAGASR